MANKCRFRKREEIDIIDAVTLKHPDDELGIKRVRDEGRYVLIRDVAGKSEQVCRFKSMKKAASVLEENGFHWFEKHGWGAWYNYKPWREG